MGTVGRNLWWTLRHLFSDRISVTLPERVADRMADVPELPEDFLVVPAFVVRARGVPRYMSGYFAVAQGQAVFLGTGWFETDGIVQYGGMEDLPRWLTMAHQDRLGTEASTVLC